MDRGSYLKLVGGAAVAGVAGVPAVRGADGLHRTLTIEGPGSTTNYEFTVEGDLAKSTAYGGTIGGSDEISGRTKDYGLFAIHTSATSAATAYHQLNWSADSVTARYPWLPNKSSFTLARSLPNIWLSLSTSPRQVSIEMWFQTLTMRIERFHSTWTASSASAVRWFAAFVHYYNWHRPNQALDNRTPVLPRSVHEDMTARSERPSRRISMLRR